MKIIYSLFLLFFIAGCSTTKPLWSHENLLDLIPLKELPNEDEKLIRSLYSEDWIVNIINTPKYKIAYNKEGNIYILKDNRVILSIIESVELIAIHAPHPAAPAAGTEKVIVQGDYIQFRSTENVLKENGLVFEDYGLNGIDVKYKFEDGSSAESFLNGKKCERTIVAGAACCTDSSGELRPYKFTPSAGWELSTNPKLVANCQKKP